ncbi:MAG: M15 family metallopeptidase [Baekduia sp.]
MGAVAALLAVPVLAASTVGGEFESHVTPVSPQVRSAVRSIGDMYPGCPVGFPELRVLTVTHWGWDGKQHAGRLIVNAKVAGRLGRVFAKLHGLRFPIRHLSIAAAYGPDGRRPKDGDISGSFECRRAVPSPCDPSATTNWSNHAYGLAVDLNPVENPYVGCGESRDPSAQKYKDRRYHRKGMVTRKVVAAFRSEGFGWGGAWAGDTKDYMHFSVGGH